jgi:hypothetical protein
VKTGKQWVIMLLGLAMLAGGLIALRTIAEPEGIMRALPYVLIGVGVGLFGHGLDYVVAAATAKRRPDFWQRLTVDEADERNIMISARAKAKGFDMMVYVFGALAVIFAVIGAPPRVILPMVGVYLFLVGYAAYWRVRFERMY